MPENQNQEPFSNERLVYSLLNEVGIIAQLSRALMETRSSGKLTLAQFSVLNHLIRVAGNPSPLIIARAFQQPKTTMTHTLATLERRGLIKMRANPDDGRSKLVHLTDAGREARENALLDIKVDMTELGDQIGIEDIRAALPILTQIRQYLDNARDET